MKISWSANNPGRWFLGCEDGRVGCKFFRWCELDYTEHARIAISGLQKRIKKHDEEKEKIRRKYRVLLIIVILSWIYREFFM
ncbi:hypothetical protein KY290_024193 [Solanum tuberosum]|uniref:Zinc finger GRF-type domain-containing protein n=1 Tax=Solanum tuberosum TaxID=4113 RepID=A0ABQ7US27_SOLTU|nr:hypothetical protein KY290_024193 [Solanum tuberosum]